MPRVGDQNGRFSGPRDWVAEDLSAACSRGLDEVHGATIPGEHDLLVRATRALWAQGTDEMAAVGRIHANASPPITCYEDRRGGFACPAWRCPFCQANVVGTGVRGVGTGRDEQSHDRGHNRQHSDSDGPSSMPSLTSFWKKDLSLKLQRARPSGVR